MLTILIATEMISAQDREQSLTSNGCLLATKCHIVSVYFLWAWNSRVTVGLMHVHIDMPFKTQKTKEHTWVGSPASSCWGFTDDGLWDPRLCTGWSSQAHGAPWGHATPEAGPSGHSLRALQLCWRVLALNHHQPASPGSAFEIPGGEPGFPPHTMLVTVLLLWRNSVAKASLWKRAFSSSSVTVSEA